VKDDLNENAETFFDPRARVVTLPAHTVIDIDYWSVREDAHKLKDYTTADIRREYGTERVVPAQAFAFVSLDKLPFDLPDETRALIKKIAAEEDGGTPAALKDRVPLCKPLRFKT
jgi:hypothetical protein